MNTMTMLQTASILLLLTAAGTFKLYLPWAQ